MMKKILLVAGLLLFMVCRGFAVEEKAAKATVESFMADKNASYVKLNYTQDGITGSIYFRAADVSGFAIAQNEIIIMYSDNLSNSEFARYLDDFSLSDVTELVYNPKTGTLTMSAKK